jgi:integrase
VWVQGRVPGGEYLRESLGVRSWEAAQKIIRDKEAGVSVETITVAIAAKKFQADCLARKLGPAQLGKYKLLFAELTGRLGERTVGSITEDDLRGYRESWKLSPISASKKLERLRTFFKFAHENNWAQTNPAKGIKPPKVKQAPTLPFSPGEMTKILKAIDSYPDRPAGRRERIRAFVLALRYSGLRIGDVISLRRDSLNDGKLHVNTQKTGQVVWCPLPNHVSKSLEALPSGEYFFWSGNGILKSAVADWQRSLYKLFTIAGVSHGHAHRFRDTFAVGLLAAGVSMENVAVLLGHSSIKITQKHYAAWDKSRQQSLESAVSQAWELAS